MEIQQSPFYKRYCELLNWHVKEIDGSFLYYKHFPLIGSIAKLQRPDQLPLVTHVVSFLQKEKIRTLACEPAHTSSQESVNTWMKKLPSFIKRNTDPFLPTKTSIIDLSLSEEKLFANFTEAKRRGVRRALKHKIFVSLSSHMEDLIFIKKKAAGFLGFITTSNLSPIEQAFGQKHFTILLASKKEHNPQKEALLAGVLLLFWKDTCYYWIAGATKEGKQTFSPTLLVWEAIKLAKKRKYKLFDFVGVWDERMPLKHHEWQGFTKFKEGFGGKPRYYPLVP